MKNLALFTLYIVISFAVASPVLADFDSYPGDNSIYGVENTTKPNVLIIIDNSKSMDEKVKGADYDPGMTYDNSGICTNTPDDTTDKRCISNQVYQRTSSRSSVSYSLVYAPDCTDTTVYVCTHYNRSGVCTRGYNSTVTTCTYTPLSVSNVPTSCGTLNPYEVLTTKGIYTGNKLNAAISGTATCDTTLNATYVTGNYINYTKSSYSADVPKIDIAKNVIKNLLRTTEGVNFGLMTYYYPTLSGEGGTFLKKLNVLGSSSSYETTIKDMDATFPSGSYPNSSCINTARCTNRDALIAAVDGLSSIYDTPLAETLYEAGRYYSGGAPAFGATVGVTSGNYTTPVINSCQSNFVIFVTDGMATADNKASVLDTVGNLGTSADNDGDSAEPDSSPPPMAFPLSTYWHSLDDVAKYLNDSTQHIITYFIGFGDVGSIPEAVTLLGRAGDDSHGKGGVFLPVNQTQLSDTLTNIMSEIYAVNTSYVAPVVPVSPQNRTYGSSRVFMGFFRPNANTYWSGNLKKYGLNTQNQVVDQNGNFATWVDEDNDRVDDRDGISLDPDASNGSFKSTSKSFWSTSVDAGTVKLGGVGEILKGQAGSRNLYTYNGSNTTLSDPSNYLSAVAYGTFGLLSDPQKGSLLGFLQGQDAYDEDSDSNLTEARSWVMGDILHSRPLVINYKTYDFTPDNEKDDAQNWSMIFVGGNDGMLHAINDYNGTERWAFVPPNNLGSLKDIVGINHPNFSDSSISAYVYDKDNDGNIETADNDTVLLIFGERRGSGTHSSPTNGYFYALDVSDRTTPKYLWSISNSFPTSGTPATPIFPELAESWSEPKIVKMKIGTLDKIVAFFGAGYDNPNEDGRYGATQGFTGNSSATNSNTGAGSVTSTPSGAALNPKGRGVYAVEVATLDSNGVPDFSNSGTKLWSATYGTGTPTAPDTYAADMTFSFPAELTAIDSNNRGYTDRLYAVDTGGNLWRFDVGDSSVSNWSANKIFSSNTTSDPGRKVFYKPSVVSELNYKLVYFGTGDREHPLNTALTDRIYAIKDPDTNTFTTKTESNLVDLTEDLLQDTSISNDETLTNQTNGIFNDLNSSSKFGWYIKLNENPGEKVLAAPTVFNKVLYITTYAPNPTTSSTACAGNLGEARVYALNYKTGEAVFNYANNDVTSINSRARDASGHTLSRADRSISIGSGIPSGVVVLISAGGQTSVMTGVGGKIATVKTKSGGTIIPLFWKEKR